jgi:hypothetical protein
MVEDREKIHDLRRTDPENMQRIFSQENLQHLRGNASCLVGPRRSFAVKKLSGPA